MTKGEETRADIIRMAAPIFNQRGFAGTSMQDIMQATGLEKGGLYRHFACKQELAVEAFRYAVVQAFASRLAHAEGLADPVDRLRAMIEAFVEQPSPVAGGCPLLNTGIDADDTNPELRLLALRSIQEWKSWIVKTVEAGQTQGRVTRKTDPARLANQMIAALEGGLLLSRLEKNRTALRDAAETLTDLLARIELHPAT